MTSTPMPNCEVCGKVPGIACVSVPGIPASAAYCAECLRANAHPWVYMVAHVACCGGWDDVAPRRVRRMVEDTCKHLGKTLDEFKADVEISLHDLEDYDAKAAGDSGQA